jgi:hypothetical protein
MEAAAAGADPAPRTVKVCSRPAAAAGAGPGGIPPQPAGLVAKKRCRAIERAREGGREGVREGGRLSPARWWISRWVQVATGCSDLSQDLTVYFSFSSRS